MLEVKAKLGEGGRLVIPAEYRKSLGLKPGDEVILVLEEGEVRLLTPHRAVRRAQALVRRYVPEGRRLADELLRERREEAARA
ncbi:MAG: AbrB/MazE/SpoVT family DNA-binding domain-containing protein [Chloroflexi bacterium]|nr:AbrB/MazE/SpoVT family DNA-binding domain-containing protein [Chloroflexota bacterium]